MGVVRAHLSHSPEGPSEPWAWLSQAAPRVGLRARRGATLLPASRRADRGILEQAPDQARTSAKWLTLLTGVDPGDSTYDT